MKLSLLFLFFISCITYCNAMDENSCSEIIVHKDFSITVNNNTYRPEDLTTTKPLLAANVIKLLISTLDKSYNQLLAKDNNTIIKT